MPARLVEWELQNTALSDAVSQAEWQWEVALASYAD